MDWTTLAVQVPLVAAFIWFALETQRRYQSSMDEMQKSYQGSMDRRDTAYLQAINQILGRLDHHDEVSQANHTAIQQAIQASAAAQIPTQSRRRSASGASDAK